MRKLNWLVIAVIGAILVLGDQLCGRANTVETPRVQQILANGGARAANEQVLAGAGGSGNTAVAQQEGSLKIDKVQAEPEGILKEDDTLTVNATGTPDCKCTFTIPGITTDQAMSEVHKGKYEGTYTILKKDTKANAKVVVTMSGAAGKSVTREANDVLAIDGNPPVLSNLAPPPDSVIHDRSHAIQAVFNDGAGTGIDGKSVRMWVNNHDVTHVAEIKAGVITYQPPSPFKGDSVKVRIKLDDNARNVTDLTWKFSFVKDQ
jgi:hypothetical protein